MLRSRTCTCATTAGWSGARRRPRGPRGRDRRARRRRRQRPAGAGRRDRRPAPVESGSVAVGGTRSRARRARRPRRGRRPHRRGPAPARAGAAFTLAENLALREYRSPELTRRGWLQVRRIATRAARAAEGVRRARRPRARSPRRCRAATSRRSSSRARSRRPPLLIAHQPTRGLDVGAIEFVHRRLIAERDAGRGILLVSLESEEVRSLADRILVIYEGRIVGELPPDASEEELGLLMTGGGSRAA